MITSLFRRFCVQLHWSPVHTNHSQVMMKSAHDGKLDLMPMFSCGLVVDLVNNTYLDSLGCHTQMTAEHLVLFFVQRKRCKTERGRQQCVLLLLPDGTTDYNFDNAAQMHGLMQSNIFEHVSIFCRGYINLKRCIDKYITSNTNITDIILSVALSRFT